VQDEPAPITKWGMVKNGFMLEIYKQISLIFVMVVIFCAFRLLRHSATTASVFRGKFSFPSIKYRRWTEFLDPLDDSLCLRFDFLFSTII